MASPSYRLQHTHLILQACCRDMSDVDEARIIIALSGKRKSGKDYIADLLLERYVKL